MNEKVQELLADWEIARQDGKEISAKDLCRDCPELLAQVKAGIEKLLTTSWLFEPSVILEPIAVLPRPNSKAEFLRLIKEFGLVSDSELENVSAEVDVDTLAGDFRRAGLLTDYQSDVLLGYKDGPIKLDRYVVLDEIGEGGMGKVYKALHTSMNRNVAIKMLSAKSISDQRKSRFRREIESVAALSHPNVVTAYDACEVDGQFILAMELIDGDDLTDVIQAGGPMDFESAAEAIRQIACAAAAAHRKGIIHRDIKPSNILLTSADGMAKLLDLGIARIQDESKLGVSGSTVQNSTDITGENVPVGTIAYMSPEQAMSAKQADERSDIYSLGCTFYYLLTGRTPFPGDSAVEVIVAHRELPTEKVLQPLDVPDYGRDILHRMIAKDPADRFESMHEVADAIEQKLSVKRLPQPQLQHAAGSESVKPFWLLMGSLLLACCAGGLAWFNIDPQLQSPDDFLKMGSETRENDLARWVLNNGGYVVATTDFGEQTIEEIEAVPDSPIHVLEIALFQPPSNFSIQWLTELPALRSLTLEAATLGGREAAALEKLENLESLVLSSSELDGTAWSSLPLIPKLSDLTLIDVPYQGKLQVLNRLHQLRSLTINNMNFSDEDFRHLSKLENLEWLDLEYTKVKSNPIDWASMLQNLKHLNLSGTNITDEDLVGRPACNQLEVFYLESCRVSSKAAEYISRLPNVAEVSLGQTNISDADLETIASQSSSIVSLDIRDTKVSAAGLEHLVTMPQLKVLVLAGMKIGDDDLKPLLKLNLDSLDLSRTQISESAPGLLSRLNLSELFLSEGDLSEDAINGFLDENPACQVYVEESLIN